MADKMKLGDLLPGLANLRQRPQDITLALDSTADDLGLRFAAPLFIRKRFSHGGKLKSALSVKGCIDDDDNVWLRHRAASREAYYHFAAATRDAIWEGNITPRLIHAGHRQTRHTEGSL